MSLNAQLYISKARSALLYFHNASVGKNGYNLKFDELLNIMSKNNPSIMMTNLGRAIYDSELNDTQIHDVFTQVAKIGNGRIPTNSNQFFYALQDNVSGISWQDVKDIAVDSASEIGSGIVSAGETVVDTMKSLQVVIPVLIVGLVGFYIFKKSRSVLA